MELSDDVVYNVTVGGLEDWIRNPICNCNDDAKLRRFACAITSDLFEGLEEPNPHCLNAISVALRFVKGEATKDELGAAHEGAAHATEFVDKREAELLDQHEEGRVSYIEYMYSFVHARACMAATACARPSARAAAIVVAYEGMAGLTAKSDLMQRKKLEGFVRGLK